MLNDERDWSHAGPEMFQRISRLPACSFSKKPCLPPQLKTIAVSIIYSLFLLVITPHGVIVCFDYLYSFEGSAPGFWSLFLKPLAQWAHSTWCLEQLLFRLETWGKCLLCGVVKEWVNSETRNAEGNSIYIQIWTAMQFWSIRLGYYLTIISSGFGYCFHLLLRRLLRFSLRHFILWFTYNNFKVCNNCFGRQRLNTWASPWISHWLRF